MFNKINLNKCWLLIIAIIIFAGCATNEEKTSVTNSEIESLRNQIKELTGGNEMISKNLVTFDTLTLLFSLARNGHVCMKVTPTTLK
jgi:hypothetical protein